MSKRLDAVFDSYETRKQSELAVFETGAAKTLAEVALGLAAIKERVVPALRDLEGAITARGHKAKLTEKLGESYPSVILEFTPAQRTKGPPFHTASRVTFTCYGGSIEAKSEVALSATRPVARIPLAELSREWIDDQVSQAIGAALEKA